ncbi:MAG: ChaN family lipoprotein [Bdellovibrionales bacterium]|nr:ChaN family lipoprotein [Bdellovibrionales bacterium]
MTFSRVATGFFLGFTLLQAACASERIFDVGAKAYVTRAEMLDRISKATDVVVGEKHDTASVQDAEARLFADFANGRRTRVTFAWEFWNWSDRAALDANYAQFRDGTLSSREFLKAVFGEKNPEPTYAPLMDAVKAAGADVLATNLSRAEKSPVVTRGIGALDPKLLPPGFALGGAEYRERFVAEMGGHGDPSEIENYFAAQSLVDDVAAYHFVEHRMTPSAFLLIGNFHTRYFDGVWKRIAFRSPGHSRVLVEIADPEDETNWQTVVHSPKYGSLADFVIFTR